MRPALLTIMLISLCACTSDRVKDPLDVPNALSSYEPITFDLKAAGPLGLSTADPLLQPRGTIDLTTKELAALDSMAAFVRSKGGELCY